MNSQAHVIITKDDNMAWGAVYRTKFIAGQPSTTTDQADLPRLSEIKTTDRPRARTPGKVRVLERSQRRPKEAVT